MRIIITQKEMCEAVEYWLNGKKLRAGSDIIVQRMSESRINDVSTFDVTVEELPEKALEPKNGE
jgi:hypothetical protein